MFVKNDEKLPLLMPMNESKNGSEFNYAVTSSPQNWEEINLNRVKDSFTTMKKTPSSLFGKISVILAAFCFSASNLFLKIAEKKYSLPPNIALLLDFGVGGILISLFVLLSKKRTRIVSVSRDKAIFVLMRVIFGSCSAFLFVNSTNLISIGDSSASFNICPTMTLVFAYLFLGEPIFLIDIFCLLLSLFGIVLMTRPTTVSTDLNISFPTQLLGVICASGAGTLASLAYISIRYLKKSVHCLTTVFYFFPVVTIFALFVSGFPSVEQVLGFGFSCMFFILLAGFFQVSGHVLLSYGLQRCPAGQALFFSNVEIPLQYLFGYLFLNEVLNLVQLFAASLIICSTIIIGMRTIQLQTVDENLSDRA